MPELPDIVVYLEHLAERVIGQELVALRLSSPFLLRSVGVPPADLAGKRVRELRRMGKRIVFGLEDDLFVVLHLMIAGRLRWREAGSKVPGKVGLAAFDFSDGTLILTEAGTKKRASLHIVRGDAALAPFARGGLEVFDASAAEFEAVLLRENHTLKRALTDPRLLSGIGNAYSDEILFRARLSPVRLTRQLKPDEIARLCESTKAVLMEWTDRLRAGTKGKFPEKVTAFREEMAVHGRYGLPCPVCSAPVQRIRHAMNETNYCANCQTGGRLLADRALSRLLKEDWPRSLDELEELKQR
ncbi:MAG: DNA-formamidopyrimidine glycosylase family protein [Gemmatimonadota bacterium]